MAKKDELLKLLTIAFSYECNEVFLYNREAELFRNKIKDGKVIADTFEKFSVMELRHADLIAAEIIRLGGKAQWSFESEKSTSLRELLAKHLAVETAMYKMYDKMLELVEDPDFSLTVKGIRENEKEHVEVIANFLKKLKKHD